MTRSLSGNCCCRASARTLRWPTTSNALAKSHRMHAKRDCSAAAPSARASKRHTTSLTLRP
eukprot:12745693-Prorocentrum_lima.AAC.1